MIDFYYWPTPNGWKVSVMLEEIGLPYKVHPVHIGKGDQFKPEFLAISPNNRIPAIVDGDASESPLAIFESGAILLYLAEKTGQLIPTGQRERVDVLQWLFWQVGGLGPMAGQLGHFINYAENKIEYAIDRYRDEYDRLLGVMDRRLADREYLAGEYSIADVSAWPWVRSHERLQRPLDDLVHLRRWYEQIEARPAVQRGVEVGLDWWSSKKMTEESRKNLFGQSNQRVSELARQADKDDD
jgi:GST-like protein